jgi:O-acetyl-ADP-ribose deacetylase (regulator of RNase III)
MPGGGNCGAVRRSLARLPSSANFATLVPHVGTDSPSFAKMPSMAEIEVLETDITQLDVDAIANAANTDLMHGGGVAGAIARAGGDAVNRESREKAPIGLGEAVETSAGEMPSKWVIHAATMELGGPTSADIIRRATASTLSKADELGAKSLALVAFGTGVGGFPIDQAASIEVEEVRRHLDAGSGLERVVFAVRASDAREAFERALNA